MDSRIRHAAVYLFKDIPVSKKKGRKNGKDDTETGLSCSPNTRDDDNNNNITKSFWGSMDTIDFVFGPHNFTIKPEPRREN